jgi:pilus assembly protein CpaB
MNMKAIIPLGLAVVLGLVAAMLVRNAIAHRSSPAVSNSNLVTVVVAKQDADPGKSLTAMDVTTARVPAETAPSHVFSDPNQLVGRVVVTQLVKGQTILDTLLAPVGSGEGLQSLIPPGMRAVTIEVNEFTGVGGMLQPGCRVDLISLVRDDKTHESVARTILQNIKVTAIGRATSPQHASEGQPLPPPANSVTLLCTPRQAQSLQMATSAGRPWLALRSTRDVQEVPLDVTTLADLRGNSDGNGDSAVTNTSLQTQSTSNDPNNSSDSESQQTTIRRTIKTIRGGVESQVIFNVPVPRGISAGNNDQQDNVIPR